MSVRERVAFRAKDKVAAGPLGLVRGETAFAIAVSVVLASAILLGGQAAKGIVSDAPVILLCCGLAVWALWRLADSARWPAPLPLVVAAAVLALPALQLVPLPPDIWTALGGREPMLTSLALTGQSAGWFPATVSPVLTLTAFCSLVVPVALFLSMHSLSTSAWRLVVAAGLCAFLLHGTVAIIQSIASDRDTLRVFDFTSDTPVGLFANRNHLGSACAVAVLLAGGLAAAFTPVSSAGRVGRYILFGASIFFFASVAVASLSRAGAALAITSALFAVMHVAGSTGGPQSRWAGLAVSALAALLLAATALTSGLIDRLASGSHRELLWDGTLVAANAFLPWGSGIGTFQPAISMHLPLELYRPAYPNQAHNDWLQLWLEGGVPGILIAGLFLLWYATAVLSLFRSRSDVPAPARHYAIAAAASIGVLLAHSIFDYPLKTLALMAVFGLCTGLLSAAGRVARIDPVAAEPAPRQRRPSPGDEK